MLGLITHIHPWVAAKSCRKKIILNFGAESVRSDENKMYADMVYLMKNKP